MVWVMVQDRFGIGAEGEEVGRGAAAGEAIGVAWVAKTLGDLVLCRVVLAPYTRETCT